MQFKVPQNVQREDTIIGPLTIKQLLILGIGGGIAYGIYISLSKTYFMEIWLPPVAIISGITLAFTFLKIHNLPFHIFLMCFLEYHLLPRKRFWIQGAGYPFIPPFEEKKKTETIKKEGLQKKRKNLSELTRVLDTGGEMNTKTAEENELSKSEKKEGLNNIINQNYK